MLFLLLHKIDDIREIPSPENKIKENYITGCLGPVYSHFTIFEKRDFFIQREDKNIR